MRGDVVKAAEYSERALVIHRRSGNKGGEAEALNILGNIYQYLGDYPKARAYLEESLQGYTEAGDTNGQAGELVDLGWTAHLLQDDTQASEWIQQALRLAEEVGHQGVQALCLTCLGRIWADQGEKPRASEAYHQAFQLRKASGEEHLALEPLAGLAGVALDSQNLSLALEYVEQILSSLESRMPPGSAPSGDGIPNLDGVRHVGWIYLTCHRVLKACRDPRARTLLQQAHAWLGERVALIEDDAMRASFLENVVEHGQIRSAFEEI